MVQTCENCGNQSDQMFSVIQRGEEHVFDCFECAIQQLAPRCAECDTKIIGHKVEFGGQSYCCFHCASHDQDRAFGGVDPDSDHAFQEGPHH